MCWMMVVMKRKTGELWLVIYIQDKNVSISSF